MFILLVFYIHESIHFRPLVSIWIGLKLWHVAIFLKIIVYTCPSIKKGENTYTNTSCTHPPPSLRPWKKQYETCINFKCIRYTQTLINNTEDKKKPQNNNEKKYK